MFKAALSMCQREPESNISNIIVIECDINIYGPIDWQITDPQVSWAVVLKLSVVALALASCNQ